MGRHINTVHTIFDDVPFNNNILHVCPASLINYTPLPMFTVTLVTHAYKVLYNWSRLLSINLK